MIQEQHRDLAFFLFERVGETLDFNRGTLKVAIALCSLMVSRRIFKMLEAPCAASSEACTGPSMCLVIGGGKTSEVVKGTG